MPMQFFGSSRFAKLIRSFNAVALALVLSLSAMAGQSRSTATVRVTTHDEADKPVAYLMASVVDACLHIDQVSVHPDSAHRRLGRALLEHAASHAPADGLMALTLTTFASADVQPSHDLGLFMVSAGLAPEAKHEQVEKIALAEIEKVKKDGV